MWLDGVSCCFWHTSINLDKWLFTGLTVCFIQTSYLLLANKFWSFFSRWYGWNISSFEALKLCCLSLARSKEFFRMLGDLGHVSFVKQVSVYTGTQAPYEYWFLVWILSVTSCESLRALCYILRNAYSSVQNFPRWFGFLYSAFMQSFSQMLHTHPAPLAGRCCVLLSFV